MSTIGFKANDPDRAAPWLSDLPPTRLQTLAALGVALATLLAFIAIAPFSGAPMGALNIFFPLLDAIVFVTDLVTAVLLFSQFAISGSRPLLALANGYLFTALIVIPHALTFNGAFSPTGLLGANNQTGSWLFIFWHLGFALALLAYGLLSSGNRVQSVPPGRAQAAIRWSVLGAIALTCALTWLSTAGTYLLPTLILPSNRLSPLVVYPIWLTILIAALAFALLAFRRRAMLDQWLMVVAFVYIGELAFSGLLPGVRFSLGFYAGRVFSILASSIVLIILLAETTRLYVLLARSHAALQRERDSRLMNFEAVVAAIGHEVRQPLGAIELNSSAGQMMLGRPSPDLAEIREILQENSAAAHRINETLISFRSLFGKIEQTRQPVDMNEVILDVLKLSRTELNAQGISARTKLTTELPNIHGNRNQLHQLIYNLAHNAIEAMSETKASDSLLEVSTSIQDRSTIVIDVQDNGPGIDPKQRSNIFEAFVTTKPHGMGLGLAICRKIVEHHDGQLSVAPAEPRGTNFRIQLSSRAPA